MSYKAKEFQKAADELIGTSGVYDEVVAQRLMEDGHIGSSDELEEVLQDRGVFRCAGCGWWCDESEANHSSDGDVCDDCYEYK